MPEFLSRISAAVNKIGAEVTRKGLELVLKVTDKIEYRVENPQNLQEALSSGRGIVVAANHTVPDYARPETLVGKLTKRESDHELAKQTGGAYLPADALLLRRLIIEMSEQAGRRVEPYIVARVNNDSGFDGELDRQEVSSKANLFTRLQDIIKLIPTAPFAGRDRIALALNQFAEQEIQTILDSGGVVIVFPQGDGYIAEADLSETPVSSSFAKWARNTDAVIVPITTQDTNKTSELVRGKSEAKFIVGQTIDPNQTQESTRSVAQSAWNQVAAGQKKP